MNMDDAATLAGLTELLEEKIGVCAERLGEMNTMLVALTLTGKRIANALEAIAAKGE